MRHTPVIWDTDRSRHQGRIVADLYQQAGGAVSERKAVLSGGLRGADKDTALAKAGTVTERYLIISVDDALRELSRRSLIPVVAGRAPLEAAGGVHAEARHVAKRLAARAMAAGTNVLLDVTAASWPSVRSWLRVMDFAGYSLDVVIADVGADEAIRWSEADYRRRQADYRRGIGDGARHVPPAAIAAATPMAAAISHRNWATQIAHLSRRRKAVFPAGEVTALIGGYRTGQLTLPELTQRFRDRPWPAAVALCPPGLEAAAPAIDDLEPWLPGSFDEVVLARDRGILSEQDYAVLARAVS